MHLSEKRNKSCGRISSLNAKRLPAEIFQLLASVLKALSLNMVVRGVCKELVQSYDVTWNLMHGISEKGLETSSLTLRLGLESFQNRRKVSVALALGENLKAVVMVSYVFLVDAKHRQQHIEKIAWKFASKTLKRRFCVNSLRQMKL